MNLDRIAEIFDFTVPEIKLIVGLSLPHAGVYSLESAREKFEEKGAEDEEGLSALIAWIGFCQNDEEIEEAFNSCQSGSPQEDIAVLRWLEIGQSYKGAITLLDAYEGVLLYARIFDKALSLITSSEEAQEMFHDTEDKEEEDKLIDVWLQLCEKEGSFENIIDELDLNDDEEDGDEKREGWRRKAIAFINASLTKKIDAAGDYDGAVAAFEMALPDSLPEKNAFLKAIQYAWREEHIEYLAENIPDEFEEELMPILIKRAYEI